MNKDLNKYSFRREISEIFAGLGTLLIDGDAFIDYIQAQNGSLLSTDQIDRFIKKLNKCGFNKIEIILFNNYFKKLIPREQLDDVFKNQKFTFFENCEYDQLWTDFISNEQICTILTNIHLKNAVGELEENDYISKIMSKNEITISLLNKINFSSSKASTFVIDYRFLLKYKLSLMKHDEVDEVNNEIEEYNFQLQKLNNKTLIDILDNKSGKVSVYKEQAKASEFLNTEAVWLTKIDVYKDENSYFKKERSDQMYYRYMQKYSESLSGNLHHKITSKLPDSNAVVVVVKKSAKELEIIKKNQEKIDKKLVEDDQDFIKKLEILLGKIVNFDDKVYKIDREIEQSFNGHSKHYMFLLRQLKLKIYFSQHNFKEKINKKICFLLKEIIENHRGEMESNELAGYLKQLKDYGFKETSKYLAEASPSPIDSDSFNKEIYLQLRYNGDKLKRTLNSRVDPRVRFEPDEWQVKLLDIVDKNESALVCCPTGAGKTFICYYAMEKILRSGNHNDMIVFVSPMKALANQVAAEIYKRFGVGTYPIGVAKNMYAMYMPDYCTNDPFNCQILITIPTMFETLICSKMNNEWLSRIKYVIIDEIQTINDKELGSSIEKIIHFLDCPILGLSATISNFDEFHQWFESIEGFKEKQRLHKVSHHERYCDLQRFLFVPKNDAIKASEEFKKTRELFGIPVENDSVETLVPIHEMMAYSKSYLKKHDYARDFHLLPTEIVTMLDALEVVVDVDNEVQSDLIDNVYPDEFFNTTLINKNDVKNYERFLMGNFKQWIVDDVFSDEQIRRLYFLLNGKCEKAFEVLKMRYGSEMSTDLWALENIFELVESLRAKKMLPAIVFVKTYKFCDELAMRLVMTLRDIQEMAEKKVGKVGKCSKVQLKKLKKELDNPKLPEDEKYRINEEIRALQNDQEEIPDQFTFLNSKKLAPSEINEEINLHWKRKIDKIMFEAWKRGIGVHHANYHTKYRSSTETLFRKQHLQVVFATETLSLGINMPCKSVVMTKDSFFFDTMLYRQMIGRAGRRGFDTIGNIVYFGVPENKIKSFISSDLIKLKGSFTYDLNNILQLAFLCVSSRENMKFVDSFVRYPISRLSDDDGILDNELVRLQINYLMLEGYLNEDFMPHRTANLILPMRQEQCAIFLISELCKNAILKRILDYENVKDKKVLQKNAEKVILMLCHFTKTVPINPLIVDNIEEEVILPKINEVEDLMRIHNSKLNSYFNWAFNDKDELEEKKSYFKKAFPYYESLPKNSYLYNFYIYGKIEVIEDIHGINVTQLWYAVKTFRILLATLVRCIGIYDSNKYLLEILVFCEDKMKERFSLIVN
jgi:superfamily II DNA or RNA helicase